MIEPLPVAATPSSLADIGADTSVDATCAWCSAPRVAGPTCPRCGADYRRAAQIRRHGRADDPPRGAGVAPTPPPPDDAASLAAVGDDGPAALAGPFPEWQLRLVALPAALLAALAFHAMLPAMQRMFFGMPVHELGHAVTAWFTGHAALPTLWVTLSAESRGVVVPIVLLGALVWMMRAAWRAGQLPLVACGAVLLLLQAIGTLGLSASTAQALIVFGGDGIGLVLATLLMLSFPLGGPRLRAGGLRWGLLVIGAAAFLDLSASWWTARHDVDAIAFGETDHGRSDPLVLLEDHGWTIAAMVRRYVTLSMACLLVLGAVYAWDARRAWRGRPAALRTTRR